MSNFVASSHSLPTHTAGLTLIELLISITVLAILLVLTLPSFKNTLMNNRVSAQIDALANSLNYARNTALSQDINVMACPAGAVGSTTCGANWQTGWIIISQPTVGAPVLLQANFSGVNDPVLSSNAASVIFDAIDNWIGAIRFSNGNGCVGRWRINVPIAWRFKNENRGQKIPTRIFSV